jgi:tetratricopeptide (TPR) repeat protein
MLTPERHFDREIVAAMLDGTLETDDLQARVAPHLLRCCAHCREIAASLREVRRPLGHWSFAVAMTEGAEAPHLWRQLAGRPFDGQLAAIAVNEELHTWGLARLLLAESRRLAEGRGRDRFDAAGHLADLALEITTHLGPAYHSGWVADLRGLAFARLGDARRRQREWAAATSAFARAALLRDAGPTSPALAAEAIELEALLRRDQGDLAAALALFDEAADLHGDGDADLADPVLPARIDVHRAWCLHASGQVDDAAAMLASAERLAAAGGAPPDLDLAIRLGKVAMALALGRRHEANPPTTSIAMIAATTAPAAPDEPLARLWLSLQAMTLYGDAMPLRQALAAFQEAGEVPAHGMEVATAVLALVESGLPADGTVAPGTRLGRKTKARARVQPPDALADLAQLLPWLKADDMTQDAVTIVLLYIDAYKSGILTRATSCRFRDELERTAQPSLYWWRSAVGPALPGARSGVRGKERG